MWRAHSKHRRTAKTSDRVRLYRELIKGRKVSDWSQFPQGTKDVYLSIARCFPGIQVYACGSRVAGDYIDLQDGEERRELRLRLGKGRPVSDFDFVVSFDAQPVAPLPVGADRLRPFVAPGGLIPVPIA